jgi:hypothetical protein
VTRGARRTLVSFAAAVALASTAGIPDATAAEISGENGLITLDFDDALWTARLDEEGQPELACHSEDCGGSSAGCGTVVVGRDGEGLSEDSFFGGFRENLGKKAIESARINAGPGANPEIIVPTSAETFGKNTGVALSMRITFDQTPTRIDHFWLQAGADLAGITCIVADAKYSEARPGFERIFSDATIERR